MIKSWRLLGAAALTMTLGAGTSYGQTVMFRHAPPGEALETVLNATKVGSGTADSSGEALVPLSLSSLNKTEIDANIFVDICDKLHRVIVVERNRLPDAQQPGCVRRDISGLYWVRPVNTLVVDVGDSTPSLLLVKGSYNPASTRSWNPAPHGLVLSGGGIAGWFSNQKNISCGNAPTCTGDSISLGFTGGVTFWLLPFLGAETTYVKPRDFKVSGSGDTYKFNSTLETQILTVAGKVGAPIGPVRLYGHAGMAYHWATSTTTETINDLTITVDNVQQVIPGGIATSGFKTEGWGYLFGGGGEVWLSKYIAIYGDLTFASLTGKDKNGSEARIDDKLRYVSFGAKVHIGK